MSTYSSSLPQMCQLSNKHAPNGILFAAVNNKIVGQYKP